jgi:hypothetical protein
MAKRQRRSKRFNTGVELKVIQVSGRNATITDKSGQRTVTAQAQGFPATLINLMSEETIVGDFKLQTYNGGQGFDGVSVFQGPNTMRRQKQRR